MIRTFETHKIRKSRELSSSLWSFHTLEGVHKDKSIPVMVPSCWETYPDTPSYRGRASYFRTFEAEGSVHLEFKGVSHTAEVYVDGKKVAAHYNAYTIFDTLIKDLIPGEHTLEVIVDNTFSADSALHVDNDYQTYGGITRGVVMDELADVYVQWVHFTPYRRAGKWMGKVEISVKNILDTRFKGAVKLYLENQALAVVDVVLEAEETKVLTVEGMNCENVECWFPENPVLYYLTAVVENEEGKAIDDLIERIGFREIKISGKDILLNGKKLFIKGLCRHEDHPQFGCSLPVAAIQGDLMIVKDLGANSIRTVHYPNDELMLDLCDEQGILVWEESHARGLDEAAMRNPNFERQCEDCIREMITAHFNHPSIYIWGILNECASDIEYGKECYAAQYALIKDLDSSRPRSSASFKFKTDICFGFPEVVSYNIYPRWYHNTPVKEYLDDLYDWVQTDSEGLGKPFLITEIGAGAIYGYRHPSKVKWTEEYQAEVLEEQIKAVFEQEGCSGVYIWQFCDVRVCDGWFEKRPRTMNNKGIVDEYRRPKLSYEVVKQLYHKGKLLS